MAQPPFQSDALQIEPSSGQTLKITRDVPTGSLRFQDAVITTGINLSDLASLSAIDGVRIVGRAGSGAKYLTIQSALDSIPSNASATNPFVILCFPGIYLENIIINKDGVAIVGMGQATITGVTNLPTVTITSGVLTTPLTTLIQGMRITTAFAGKECVLISGGPGLSVGFGGIFLKNCNLAAKGVGSYTCRASVANFVQMDNCTSDESDASAVLGISQCASFIVSGGTHPATQADYDTGGPIPVVTSSAYVFEKCRNIGPMLSTLQNAGNLKIFGCTNVGTVTVNGNRGGSVQNSIVGNLTAGGTSALVVTDSQTGTLAGTGTIDVTFASGSVSFVAATTHSVTFTVARPDANYSVLLDTGVSTSYTISGKSATGFTITFGSVVTTTVLWTVVAL